MKPSSALPIHYDSKPVMTPSYLPPTPSSINAYYMNEDTKGKRPFMNTATTYGSMSSNNALYLDVSRPITPSQTTISPNENDGGLYLLWTEQLLREKGYEPSTRDDDDSSLSSEDEEQDNDDMYITLLNSSQSQQSILSSRLSVMSSREDNRKNSFFQLFNTCFTPSCT